MGLICCPPTSGVFKNEPVGMPICVCLYDLCVLFIFLCSIFVFNFVFTLSPCLHSFVYYSTISNFQTFKFCVLLYLYDSRIFPMLFFFNLSTSLIRPSSLTTVHSLLLPFFLVRSIPVHGRCIYFHLLFCFHFSVSLSIASIHPLHRRHFTSFFTSSF